MKHLLVLFVLFTSGILVAGAQTRSKNSGVEVYYFHETRRCATCNAVEKVTREALNQYYGDQISLKSMDREDNKNEVLVKKYKVAIPTLLIVKADKKVDLTSIAFMNAERSPYKLKTKIKETIDNL